MKNVSIKFFGHEHGQFGMPQPYHSYLIIASKWKTNNSGVASVISLTDKTPMPNQSQVLVLDGGIEKAYQDIVEILKAMPANCDLEMLIDEN